MQTFFPVPFSSWNNFIIYRLVWCLPPLSLSSAPPSDSQTRQTRDQTHISLPSSSSSSSGPCTSWREPCNIFQTNISPSPVYIIPSPWGTLLSLSPWWDGEPSAWLPPPEQETPLFSDIITILPTWQELQATFLGFSKTQIPIKYFEDYSSFIDERYIVFSCFVFNRKMLSFSGSISGWQFASAKFQHQLLQLSKCLQVFWSSL